MQLAGSQTSHSAQVDRSIVIVALLSLLDGAVRLYGACPCQACRIIAATVLARLRMQAEEEEEAHGIPKQSPGQPNTLHTL